MLDGYRKIAEITQRQGVEVHGRMLDRVARLRRVRMCPPCRGMSTKQNSTRGWVTNGMYSYGILPEATTAALVVVRVTWVG